MNFGIFYGLMSFLFFEGFFFFFASSLQRSTDVIIQMCDKVYFFFKKDKMFSFSTGQ